MTQLFTAKETAKILRVSEITLHRWRRDGKIPFVRINGSIRYREKDLEKIINEK